MTAYSKKYKVAPKSGKQEERPDGSGLYFNNNGLFSENYLLHRLPNEKRDPFVLEHWETEPLPEFSECYEWMLSAWDEYKTILPELNEAQLEDKWIRPILKRLGWNYEVQDRLKKRGKTQIPDYSLFADEQSYLAAKGARTDGAYFKHALAVADAKGMGINLDGSGRTNSNPSYQIIRYMEDTGKTWGVLTDGEYWRLYSLNSESKFTTFFEVNIRKALANRDDERFKYFFNFFRKEAFVPKGPSSQSFLDVVFKGGEQYAQEVEKQLRHRAFRITQSICRGFASEYKSLNDEDLNQIYQHSLFYLFRLMFILNAEAKGIFDANDLSNYYPSSLRNLAVDLKKDFEIGRKWSGQHKSYQYLTSLMSLLEKGDSSIEVFKLGSEIFGSRGKDFFNEHQIPDSALNSAIVELACAYDDEGELKYIDYKRLSPDHLGSLFEGLLDYKLTTAKEKLADDGKTVRAWSELTDQKKQKLKSAVIEKGELYLESGTGSRKDSGSYYTPIEIVDYIVEETLQPLSLGKSAEEILKLRVCDPAMGSGHFLIGAIKYLEERVLDAIYAKEDKPDFSREDIRREILHNCMYGIDLNPLAVELAKFSLWMYTVRKDAELEPLADQLLCADSLTDDVKISRHFADVKKDGGFNGIVGNPPYVNTFLLERILARNPTYKEDIKAKLRSARGAFDICSLFIEVGRRIGPNARIGYILPNKLIAVDSAIGMRDFIKDDPSVFIESIDDASHVPIFEDASVYPIILIFGTREPKSIQFRKHEIEFNPDLVWEQKKFPSESQSYLADLVASSELKDFESFELGKKFEIFAAATVDEAYKCIKPNLTEKRPKKSVKFMVSGNVLSFGCTWGVQKVQYLKAGYESPYLDLSASAIIPKRVKQYQSLKIIVPNMTQMIRAYVDNGEYAPGISTTMIMGSKDELKAIAAYINSAVATEIYSRMFESLHLNGGALRVGTPQLAKLPVPSVLLADKKTREKAITLYDQISDLVAKMIKSGTKTPLIRNILDRQEIKPGAEKGNLSIKLLQKAIFELDEFFVPLVGGKTARKQKLAK